MPSLKAALGLILKVAVCTPSTVSVLCSVQNSGVEGGLRLRGLAREAHHGGMLQGPGVQVAGGVAALGLQVEVWAQGGSREGQGATPA